MKVWSQTRTSATVYAQVKEWLERNPINGRVTGKDFFCGTCYENVVKIRSTMNGKKGTLSDIKHHNETCLSRAREERQQFKEAREKQAEREREERERLEQEREEEAHGERAQERVKNKRQKIHCPVDAHQQSSSSSPSDTSAQAPSRPDSPGSDNANSSIRASSSSESNRSQNSTVHGHWHGPDRLAMMSVPEYDKGIALETLQKIKEQSPRPCTLEVAPCESVFFLQCALPVALQVQASCRPGWSIFCGTFAAIELCPTSNPGHLRGLGARFNP